MVDPMGEVIGAAFIIIGVLIFGFMLRDFITGHWPGSDDRP